MRKIFAIAKNDLKLEFSSRDEIIFFLILPMLFTWIIGLTMQSMFTGDEDSGDNRTPITIINEDNGEIAANLITVLNQSDLIRPLEIDAETAWQRYEDEEISALLSIPADFSASTTAMQNTTLSLTLNPKYSSSTLIKQAVEESILPINQTLSIVGLTVTDGQTQSLNMDQFNQVLASYEDPLVYEEVVYPEEAQQETQYSNSFQLSSPGQLVTWVLISLSGSAVVFVNERKYGTLRRLLITPTQRSTILGGKIVSRVTMGLVQMILLIIFGRLVLNINWGHAPLALALVLVSFAFTGTSLGLMLGTYAKTPRQAAGLSTIISMVLSALGGAWWPLEITPHLYQQIVKIFPSTWAMIGFNRIVVAGQGLQAVLLPCVILWGYTLVFFALSIHKLRFE
jgi:ABC-2 type transport system permease protein